MTPLRLGLMVATDKLICNLEEVGEDISELGFVEDLRSVKPLHNIHFELLGVVGSVT